MVLVGVLALQISAAGPEVGRIDLADRVKRLDMAWVSQRDSGRRAAAVSEISGAVMAFFSGRQADACLALDRATATLNGRSVSGLDALIVRAEPRVVKPGQPVKLSFGWAYPAPDASVRILGKTYPMSSKMATSVTLICESKEGTQQIQMEESGVRRPLSVQVVKDFGSRLAKLKASPKTSALADALGQVAAGSYETEVPVADWIAKGEKILASGWKSVEEIPAVDHADVRFRVQIPRGVSNESPVVIALHGAGGSENMFFESYGAGMAPKEAKKRGWIFMSPRSVNAAVPACLSWLREELGIKPRKVFVMGHSMGGGVALGGGTASAKPDALALFAPASGGVIPATYKETPIFLAVGKQEMPMLRTSASRLGTEIAKRQKSVFKEYEQCEHLMIVADASADAFAFFDNVQN